MEAGKYYHIYNRGVNRETIFKEGKNYSYFLERYKHHCSLLVETLCYCLMPNHFHLFVRLKDDTNYETVTKGFKDFFISYAKSINKSYDRTGSLFQNKYKKKEIDREAYFSMIIAYLHLNPVSSGLVKFPDDWKFSSYKSLITEGPTQLCREQVLEWFGGKESFIEFHQLFQDEDETKPLLY
jgi:REP element-mobilizing transposase RayT